MITLKEKLTAIKGSIEKWDKVSKGEIKDEGSGNCPLCKLFLVPHTCACAGCPIFEKTGGAHCAGTPWGRFRELTSKFHDADNFVLRGEISLAAAIFRDWLKDLYIEVSEAGDFDDFKKWLEEFSIYKEEGEKAGDGVTEEEDFKKRVEKLRIKHVSLEDTVLATFETRVSALEGWVNAHSEK